MLKQVQFQGIKSLLDVTVDLEPFTVLVGPNGCGKSTLLDQIELLGALSRPEPSPANSFGAAGMCFGAVDPDGLQTLGAEHSKLWRGADASGARFKVVVQAKASNVAWSGRMGVFARPADSEGERRVTGSPGEDRRALEAVLEGMERWTAQRLALVPRDIARPAEVTLLDLEPNGYGLPTVLKDLAANHTRRYLDLQADLRRVVPHFRELRIGKSALYRPEPLSGQVPLNTLEFVMVQGTVPAARVSDGTLIALALLTAVHNPDLPRIVLLDDIDHGLHLGAQHEMIKAIRAVQKVRPELQVICTTHSPVLLDSFEVAEVRVMALDKDGHTVVKPLKDHPKVDSWRAGFSPGELWANLGEDWVING